MPNAVYDPEDLKQKESHPKRMDDDGAKALSDYEQEKLAQIEAGFGDTAVEPTKAHNQDKKDGDDQAGNEGKDEGSFYNPDGSERQSKWRARIVNKKSAVGGGIIGLIAFGLFNLFSVGQGPLQLIHLSQLLSRFHFSNNSEFNNDRSARRLYYLNKGEVQRSRLGFAGNKIADKVEAKFNEKAGLKSIYEKGLTGKFVGYEILDESKASRFLNDMKVDKITIGERDGRQFVDLRDFKPRENRSVVRTLVKASDIDGVVGRISSRLLIRRTGSDFHPLKNVKRDAADKLLDYYKKLKAERNERIREGVDTDLTRAPEAESPDADQDGKPDGEPGPDLQDAENAAEEVFGEVEATDIASTEATAALRKSLLGKFLKVGGGAAAAVGVLCTLKDLGNGAEKLQYVQTILPMIRTSVMFMAVGSQIQAGQGVNIDEVGSLASELYDESNDNDPATVPSSAFSSQPMQAENGEPLTGTDIAEYLKPGKLGQKPEFFAAIDRIPGIGEACGLSNFFSGLPIIKQVGDFTSSIVSSVLPIDELVSGVIGWLAGQGMDYSATGGPLGAIVMYGGRLAANNQSAAEGGVEIPETESIKLAMYNQESVNYDFNHRSFLAKAFDTYDSRSLVSRLAMSMPRSATGLLSSLSNLPSSFAWAFSPKAFAQSSYDYGFNEVGFTVDEINSELIDDPYENAQIVEPQLDALNEKYGKECFNLTVVIVGDDIKINNGTEAYNPSEHQSALAECNNSTDPLLLRYRAYIADAVGARAEACYEGVDETACAEMGFGAANESGAPSGSSGLVNPNGYSFPLEPQTKAVGGIDQGHHDGTPAFDLFSIPSADVYAIYGGTPTKIRTDFNGVPGCSSIQFKADDGFYYWYGHLKNPTVRVGQHVAAGAQIAEIADLSLGSKCYGGAPHLHIDRGCTINGIPQPGGADACRDPDFIPFLRALWETLPNG